MTAKKKLTIDPRMPGKATRARAKASPTIMLANGKQLTETPCPRCSALARDGFIRPEVVMPLPRGVMAARARPPGSGPVCDDCAAADALIAFGGHPDFMASRITVGNARQEDIRLPPGIRENIGLVKLGYVSPCVGEVEDVMATHHAWLDRVLPGWRSEQGPDR